MKGYYPSTGCRDSIIMTDGSAGTCKYIGTALSSVSSQPCIPSPASHELLASTTHPKPSLHVLLCATLIFLPTQPMPASHHLFICR